MGFYDINDRWFSVVLPLFLARLLPRRVVSRVGHSIADFLASRRNSLLVRTVLANQWVVRDGAISSSEFDSVVKSCLRNTADCLADFYSSLGKPQVILKKVAFSERFQAVFDRCTKGEAGSLFVFPHTSCFDIAGQALSLRGMQIFTLSLPNPSDGNRIVNQMRRTTGMNVSPLTPTSLKTAKDHLKVGGTVLTGLDRPVETNRRHPRFFGHLSSLPLFYVRLALQAHVPITVVACRTVAPGSYIMDCSPTIELVSRPDGDQELIENGERVLSEAEQFIRAAPDQWSMAYPVWPDVLKEMFGPA